jgi:hypothetical protein
MELVERLKNKVSYYIYKTVNDEEANHFAEEKKEKEQEQKQVEDTKTEKYDDVPPATTEATETIVGVDTKYIWAKVKEYATYFLNVLLIPLLALYMASFVSNELIMYPAGIRIVFFLFTLFICATTKWVTYAMCTYYFGKKIYQTYLNRERDDKPNPPIRLMPKIFAFLPIMIKDPNASGFLESLKRPFQYLKEDADEANEFGKTSRDSLNDIMETYKTSLKESFPFYETVKTNDIFVKRQEQLDEHFSEMHDQPQKRIIAPTLPTTINQQNIQQNVQKEARVAEQNAQAAKFIENAKAKQAAATQFFAPQAAPNQETPQVNQEMPQVNQEATPVNQEVSQVNQEKTQVNQEKPPVNQEATPVNKDKTPVNKEKEARNAEQNAQAAKFVENAKAKQAAATQFFAPQASPQTKP